MPVAIIYCLVLIVAFIWFFQDNFVYLQPCTECVLYRAHVRVKIMLSLSRVSMF
jgi:hypothetical protein